MKSANRRFKDAIYEQLARIGKALSSPQRLELLDLLCQAPRSVESLANESGQSVANTSRHLQVLRMARLVEGEREGQFVIYRLADGEACEFTQQLRELAHTRLAEVDQILREFLGGREGMEPVDKETLLAQVRRGEVVVLDVRPQEEYQAGHIAGALSVPLEQLEERIAALPHDQEIVAYCRGPYCVLSVEAVDRLRGLGFRAVRLEDSVLDWRRRGFRVAVGDDP